jgi:DNA modification methylase
VKVLCDELLGSGSYASEIVWRYRRWPSKARNYQRVHDVLLRFVKNPEKAKFNTEFETLAPSTLRNYGGRAQSAQASPSGRKSVGTSVPSPGTPLGDVWDLSIVAPSGAERTGYPTQKPLALLDRLITTLTDPGDLVLDPFCGSGTTLVSAQGLGRRALGMDQSADAIAVTKARIAALGEK